MLGESVSPSMIAVTLAVILCVASAKRFAARRATYHPSHLRAMRISRLTFGV